eukprot:3259398-Rhodomonas_salina.1
MAKLKVFPSLGLNFGAAKSNAFFRLLVPDTEYLNSETLFFSTLGPSTLFLNLSPETPFQTLNFPTLNFQTLNFQTLNLPSLKPKARGGENAGEGRRGDAQHEVGRAREGSGEAWARRLPARFIDLLTS